jgi:hypothetical protein
MNLHSKIDHLIYKVSDLHQGIEIIQSLTGVAPVIAGRHQGEGTWNALMSLGEGIYFEVIASDPAQGKVPSPSWRDAIEPMPDNRLVRFCAKTDNAHRLVKQAKEHDIDLGAVMSGSREKNDGSTLTWTLTDFKANTASMIPFFIDWGDSEHPSRSLPGGCSLKSLEAVHPKPDVLRSQLKVLDLPLKVYAGNEERFIARLDTPKGEVVLM